MMMIMIIIIIMNLRHSVHFTYPSLILHCPVYTQQSTHLPLLLLPVRGWFKDALPMQMFPPTAEMSKCAFALSETYFLAIVRKSKCAFTWSDMSYFYGLPTPGTFRVLNGILRATVTEQFKTQKSEIYVTGRVRTRLRTVCRLDDLWHAAALRYQGSI